MSKHSEKKVSRRGHRLTPLGARLDEIRARIETSGEPRLSSWEEVDRELKELRGETRERDSKDRSR